MGKIDARKIPYVLLILAGLVFLAIYIWMVAFNIPSSYTDISYHLATAQGFVRVNGIVTWDFWESLPIGRPHNYPPLFHLILASILKSGINPSSAMKIMMELTVVGGLAIYTLAISKLFNIKVGFWSFAVLATSFHFIQLSSTVMPSTMAVFLAPSLFYLATNKKWVSYSALLVLLFYLHLFIPYFILFSILLYFLIFDRAKIKHFLAASSAAFLVYTPWLIHIFLGGFEYIKYFDSNTLPDMWGEYILINLGAVILIIAGTIFLFLKKLKLPHAYFFFLISSLVILSPSYLIASRLIDGHFLAFAAPLTGLFLSALWETKAKFFALGLLIFLCLYTPVVRIGNGVSLRLLQSSFSKLVYLSKEPSSDPSIKYGKLINLLKANSKPGDPLTTLAERFDGVAIDKNYQLSVSNILASYAELSTLNLRQPEIYHRPLPDIKSTKFLLIDTSPFDLNPGILQNLGYGNQELVKYIRDHFNSLGTISFGDGSDSAYLLINNGEPIAAEKPVKRVIPIWTADILTLLLVVAAIGGERIVNKCYEIK